MELMRNCFVQTLRFRISLHTYHLKGKYQDKLAWCVVLVDWDKECQFKEYQSKSKTNLEILRDGKYGKYGKILYYGWGHDIPQKVKNVKIEYFKEITESFFLIRFETDGCSQIYYVLSGVEEREIKAVASAEDLKMYGRILHSSFDEDPPEALAYILEAKYFLLNSKIKLNFTCPIDAVRNGDLQNVREYLNSGGDVNCTDARGWTLLHYFAHYGNIDVIILLKTRDADFQVRDRICGRKPVHIAAREGHEKAVEFFLKNGAIVNEVDENNWSLLHYATWKGDVKTVRLLIENNAEINAKDLTVGKKPIHLAAEYGHTDVIDVLLENDVNIDDLDNVGRTPFYYASLMGNLEAAEFLIGNGADFHKKTKYGDSPIHAAVLFKSIKMLDLFFTLGVNVDELDDNGNTPLHLAMPFGNFNLVKFLVDKNANCNRANKFGKKPIDYNKGDTDIFLYLADRMVTVFLKEEKYDYALKYCKDMLKILEEKLGWNHPETLRIRQQETKCLYEQGQYDTDISRLISEEEV